jgi:mono/diheme cytochrome c family protein
MSTPEILPQQQRENPEPQESGNPMPWFVVTLTALLLAFGVVYIAGSSIELAPALGDGRTMAELQGAPPAAAGAVVDGAAVYSSRCAACHQANGAGIADAFPPLAQSEWVVGDPSTLVSVVLHGVTGPLTVKGSAYNGQMPAFGAQLNDVELAAVLSHVRGQFGNAAAPITPANVAAVRSETAMRTEPYAGDAELKPTK